MVIISQNGKQAFFVGSGMYLSVMGKYLFLDNTYKMNDGQDYAYDARIGEFGSEEEAMRELARLSMLYAQNDVHIPHRVSKAEGQK